MGVPKVSVHALIQVRTSLLKFMQVMVLLWMYFNVIPSSLGDGNENIELGIELEKETCIHVKILRDHFRSLSF